MTLSNQLPNGLRKDEMLADTKKAVKPKYFPITYGVHSNQAT